MSFEYQITYANEPGGVRQEGSYFADVGMDLDGAAFAAEIATNARKKGKHDVRVERREYVPWVLAPDQGT